MRAASPYPAYTNAELIADAVVHVIGIGLAVAGVALLLGAPDKHGPQFVEVALYVYSAGLLTMLIASAAYHLAAHSSYRFLLRRIDHAAIYLKIAATITPLAILANTNLSLATLIPIWLFAIVGAGLKLLSRPGKISDIWLPHLILGWLGGLTILVHSYKFGAPSLWYLTAGGLVYSGALVFYSAEKLPFANALWHGCVVIATGLMYFSILYAVLGA